METQAESYELEQAFMQLPTLSGDQWETLEEAGDLTHPPKSPASTGKRVGRTPVEIEREIAQDAQELGALFAKPHHPDGAMVEELLGVSDELQHVAQGERLGENPVDRFGRRPPPTGKA